MFTFGWGVVGLGNGGKAIRQQRLVLVQITDERVLLNELELVLLNRRCQEAAQFVQVPHAVGRGQLTGGFDVGRSVFAGQLQKALQNPDALWPAITDHRFSPLAGVRADQPRQVQEVIQTVFNGGAFARVDVLGIGAEPARLLPGVQGDLFHARVVDAHQPQIPPRPHPPPDIFGRHRVIRPGHFDVPVQMHVAQGFGKYREDRGG